MVGSGRNWPIIIPKHRLCPKVFPKFFLCAKPKNSWKYSKKITPPPQKKRPFFFGGGGGVMILNVVFAGFDAAWWTNIFLYNSKGDQSTKFGAVVHCLKKSKIFSKVRHHFFFFEKIWVPTKNKNKIISKVFGQNNVFFI